MSLVNRLIDNIKLHSDMKITVASVLLRNSKPIGRICCNSKRNYCRGKVCSSIHAEANAMLTHFGKHISYSPKYGWYNLLKNAVKLDVMVIRVDYLNNLVNARPCYQCLLMMKNMGINKVYYSIDNIIVCEKVSNMISINSSTMLRKINLLITGDNTYVYYKKILDMMPKETKRKNAQLFINNIKTDLPESYYTLTDSMLSIYYEDELLANINII